MKQKLLPLAAAAVLLMTLTACQNSGQTVQQQHDQTEEVYTLTLSDGKVELDGQELPEDTEDGRVTVTHDIVYYQSGMGADYGEGTAADEHPPEEALAHKVVTIRQPGTYRVSGTLTAGQLAVDLGEEAKSDPGAVVTLILDGVDINCTVAPAVIFYHVYECDTDWVSYDEGAAEDYQSASTQDTSGAGANVVLADGSVNHISGSYVARIYQEGTTKKLHKYDGAFYSRMSMNISGETEGTGTLSITAANEGLDSELHLTINGGTILIQAQNDGINTNEDGVSVTTINGGTLEINAGLGEEGDGIDSNGYLVINGGTVYTLANDRSPDGGLDADLDILINGGHVVALGTRNDAVSSASGQMYMELSFASTLPAGSVVELADPEGNALLSLTTEKAAQSLTFSSPELDQDTVYTLTVDGVVQQYSGNMAGGFGGMGGHGGGLPPSGGQRPPEMQPGGQRPEGGEQPSERPQRPDGEGRDDGQRPPFSTGGQNGGGTLETEGSTEFILTDTVRSFSGISDSAQSSGKTTVAFSAQVAVGEDGSVTVSQIEAGQEIDASHVQISVTDIPSEDYAASCLLSEGDEALAAILPTDPGTYCLTIAVTGDDAYTGASQFRFIIPDD